MRTSHPLKTTQLPTESPDMAAIRSDEPSVGDAPHQIFSSMVQSPDKPIDQDKLRMAAILSSVKKVTL